MSFPNITNLLAKHIPCLRSVLSIAEMINVSINLHFRDNQNVALAENKFYAVLKDGANGDLIFNS